MTGARHPEVKAGGGLEDVFAPDGVLASALPGYRARPSQLEMAEAIGQAIRACEVLVAEAGTGTGKTFAYLVPALLSGGKVILSTGTRTLQDQLFRRDIPLLREALNVPVQVALLKGRANYICHHHLKRTLEDGRLSSRDDVVHLQKVKAFARTTRSGDRSELADVPEHSGVWSHVTSTRDNCLGQDCEFHQECFVLAARREAQAADLVVVNHHLFFADVMLRDEGAAELLPACNSVIFDEAHQLPETASLFFGETLASSQLLELARDTCIESVAAAADYRPLPDAAEALDRAVRDLRLAFRPEDARMPADAALARDGVGDAMAALRERLGALFNELEHQAERSEELGNCLRRAVELRARLEHWCDDEDEGAIRWVEVFSQSVQLNNTPVSVAETFQRQLEGAPKAWIFTSATLSVRGDFSHYCGQMGLAEARTLCWDSPFDYAKQALFYVPPGLPEPNTPQYTEGVVDALMPVLRASHGRAFCLFTSLRAMNRAAELLRERFRAEGLGFPLLVQGEGGRTELLQRFRTLGNAVLVASQSFWEGVDVKGEALSVVAIDKLPFAPPDDPVLSARLERMRRDGHNPFMDYQLPQAVISLKQGAGRLIRDESDRGVLMICDPRLLSKPYGRVIWRSLPPMRRTRALQDVTAFFAPAGASDEATGGVHSPAVPGGL